MLVLPPESSETNEHATVALGYRSRKVWDIGKTHERTHAYGSYRYSFPSRSAVNDLIMHQSLWAGGVPKVFTVMHGSGTGPPSQGDRTAFDMSVLPLETSSGPATPLSQDCRELTWSGAPTYVDAVRTSMRHAGIDPR